MTGKSQQTATTSTSSTSSKLALIKSQLADDDIVGASAGTMAGTLGYGLFANDDDIDSYKFLGSIFGGATLGFLGNKAFKKLPFAYRIATKDALTSPIQFTKAVANKAYPLLSKSLLRDFIRRRLADLRVALDFILSKNSTISANPGQFREPFITTMGQRSAQKAHGALANYLPFSNRVNIPIRTFLERPGKYNNYLGTTTHEINHALLELAPKPLSVQNRSYYTVNPEHPIEGVFNENAGNPISRMIQKYRDLWEFSPEEWDSESAAWLVNKGFSNIDDLYSRGTLGQINDYLGTLSLRFKTPKLNVNNIMQEFRAEGYSLGGKL